MYADLSITGMARARLWMPLLLVAAFGFACSGDSSSPGEPPPPPDPADAIAAGWIEFEAGRYTDALEDMNAAVVADPLVAEGHWGRGWALARLGAYVDGQAAFESAVDLMPSAADAQAGLALSAAACGAHEAAITAVGELLSLAPSYVFAHDPSVGAADLRLLRAQLYYRTGDFDSAALDLDVLDPGGAPHSSEPLALLDALAAHGGAVDP